MKKGLIIGKGWLGSRLEKYLEKQFLIEKLRNEFRMQKIVFQSILIITNLKKLNTIMILLL